MPNADLFETWDRLLLGLGVGFVFGFLLQKGQVTKYRTIVGQFLFRDFTVLKTMLTAIVVGGIGVYALKDWGYAELHIKTAMLVVTVGGGLVFGVGMALLGYCPGTGVAAIAEGSRHAIWGTLGMLFGAFVLAESYGVAADFIQNNFNYGKATLPEMTGVSPWTYWAAIVVVAGALFAAIEWYERRGRMSLRMTSTPSGPVVMRSAR